MMMMIIIIIIIIMCYGSLYVLLPLYTFYPCTPRYKKSNAVVIISLADLRSLRTLLHGQIDVTLITDNS